jgi:small-conductance mechanosensitive channel
MPFDLSQVPQQLLKLARDPSLWWEIAVLGAALLLAWALDRYWSGYVAGKVEEGQAHGLRRMTLRSAQRLLFPFTMLVLVLGGRAILHELGGQIRVLDIAVPLLLSLAAIRVSVYILRKAFSPTAALKAWEQTISTTIWVGVALHLLGWLPGVLQALDALAVTVGGTRISLLAVIKLIVYAGVTLALAFWLSGIIERRVSHAEHMGAGMRVGLAKVSRFVLLTVAILVALNAIGIDLTALTVFGGALGVGLGFGLQRIASNFVSGFILVFDRSIRPGDVITLGDSFGWVVELRARYVVIRNRDGVEMLIPNENLITSEVINWSYSDRKVRLKIPVQISYGDDPEQAMKIMLQAARGEPRVLPDPAPVCRLMGFGDNGIELELRVWIRDPEEGVNNVRSNVNLAIWRGFKQHHITIPFPQRDLHVKQLPPRPAAD